MTHKKTIHALFLIFCMLVFSMLTFLWSHSVYAATNQAFLVDGLDNYKAGKDSIKKMKSIISSNDLWKSCNISQYFYNGTKKDGISDDEFIKKMKAAFSNCKGKTAIFYYVGHGAESNAKGTGLQLSKNGYVSYTYLANELTRIDCKKMVVILDCCKSGELINEIKQQSGYKSDKTKFLILTSSSAKQDSYFDKKKYFSFTKALYDGLTGSDNVFADINKNGTVTMQEIVTYVNMQMTDRLLSNGKKSKKIWGDQTAQSLSNKKVAAFFSYSFDLGLTKKSIYIGQSITLKPKYLNRKITFPSKIKWSVNKKGIISTKVISLYNINVTGKKSGKVTLTGTYFNHRQSSVNLTVKNNSVTLNKSKVTLHPGDEIQLKATVKGIKSGVIWKSNNPDVVTVNSEGKITAITPGKGEITATANNKKANCTVTVELTPSRKVAYVSCSGSSTMLVTEDGSLWVGGDNSSGQLATGTYSDIKKFTLVQDGVKRAIVNYWGESGIIKTDDSLWVCGDLTYGMMGAQETRRALPIKIMDQVADICPGFRITFIIKKDGTLWMCGETQPLGTDIWTGEGPVQIADNVKMVSTGHGFYAYLKQDNTLWMAGKNDWWQLGNPEIIDVAEEPVKIMDQVVYINSYENNTVAVKEDGSLWLWGRNNSDSLNVFHAEPRKYLDNVSSVAMGLNFIVALKKDGTVWSMGENFNGQLGDGTATNRNQFVKVMSDVKQVSAGYCNSAFLKNDGSLWMCGPSEGGHMGEVEKNCYYSPIAINW